MSVKRGLDSGFAHLRRAGRPISEPVVLAPLLFHRLVAELYFVNGDKPVIENLFSGRLGIVYDGVRIQTLDLTPERAAVYWGEQHPCDHDAVTKFTDATYCHDCRTLTGDGHIETHRRTSSIGTN